MTPLFACQAVLPELSVILGVLSVPVPERGTGTRLRSNPCNLMQVMLPQEKMKLIFFLQTLLFAFRAV